MNLILDYFDANRDYTVVDNEIKDAERSTSVKYQYKLYIYLNNPKREYMVFRGFIWDQYVELFDNIPTTNSNYTTQAVMYINIGGETRKISTNDIGLLLLYLNRDGHKIRTVEQGYYEGKTKHVVKTATMYENN